MATRKPVKRALSERIGNDNLLINLQLAIGLDRIEYWEDEFKRMGAERFPRALQFSLNAVAREAKAAIGEAIDRVIDRPSQFSRVNDTGRSSVLTRGRGLDADSDYLETSDMVSGVYVQDKQSSYFKYMMGETIRLPGDVGPSEDHISVPVFTNLLKLQGIGPTAEGGMPRGTLKTLRRREDKYSRGKVREMGDTPEARALKRHRKTDSQYHTTFFGRPYGVFGDVPLGWWDRPNTWMERTGPVIQTGKNKGKRKLERVSDGRPKLLVVAVDHTKHNPILVDAWNAAVANAADRLSYYLDIELNDRLAWQGRHTTYQGGHGHDARSIDEGGW